MYMRAGAEQRERARCQLVVWNLSAFVPASDSAAVLSLIACAAVACRWAGESCVRALEYDGDDEGSELVALDGGNIPCRPGEWLAC